MVITEPSFATIISVGVTIFSATTVFAEIQSSLNTIWGIKAVPRKSWLKYIIDILAEKKNFYINGNSAFIDWIRCNYRVKIYNKIGEKNGKKNNWQHKI